MEQLAFILKPTKNHAYCTLHFIRLLTGIYTSNHCTIKTIKRDERK